MQLFFIVLVVKFDSFSAKSSQTSAAAVNLALLPVEASNGSTGYPPIKNSLLQGDLVWLARDGGAIEAFSISGSKLTDIVVFPFPEDRKLVGLFEYKDDSVLAVSNRGDLVTWSAQDSAPKALEALSGATEIQAVAKFGQFLAVGGKGTKNNLKVFSLAEDGTVSLLYTAKPTMNTRLNLPFTVDIRAICFFDPSKLAISNSDGQIFFYDFTRQISSVSHHQVLPKKTAIASLSPAEREGCVIYTDLSGVIESYDLFKGRSYGRFKPHEGSIQSFQLIGSNSFLLTLSKDRFLRIFNFSTRSLVHKVYLKHVPITLQVANQTWLEAQKEQYENSEDEEVWEGMTRVSDKKRTKTE